MSVEQDPYGIEQYGYPSTTTTESPQALPPTTSDEMLVLCAEGGVRVVLPDSSGEVVDVCEISTSKEPDGLMEYMPDTFGEALIGGGIALAVSAITTALIIRNRR